MLAPWRYASVTSSAPQLRGMPMQLSAVQFGASPRRTAMAGPKYSDCAFTCFFGAMQASDCTFAVDLRGISPLPSPVAPLRRLHDTPK
jgi:hypothetical protein